MDNKKLQYLHLAGIQLDRFDSHRIVLFSLRGAARSQTHIMPILKMQILVPILCLPFSIAHSATTHARAWEIVCVRIRSATRTATAFIFAPITIQREENKPKKYRYTIKMASELCARLVSLLFAFSVLSFTSIVFVEEWKKKIGNVYICDIPLAHHI